MATDKVQFELVDPERMLASEDVDMVVVPGSEGDFGVLPLHAPLVSSLRPGVIRTYQGNEVADRYFVAGGFVEVNEKACTVLAEDAVELGELDAAAERKRMDEATRLMPELDETEQVRYRRVIVIAQARIEAVEIKID